MDVIRDLLNLTASSMAASDVSPGMKRCTARCTNPRCATRFVKKTFSDPHRRSFRSIGINRWARRGKASEASGLSDRPDEEGYVQSGVLYPTSEEVDVQDQKITDPLGEAIEFLLHSDQIETLSLGRLIVG